MASGLAHHLGLPSSPTALKFLILWGQDPTTPQTVPVGWGQFLGRGPHSPSILRGPLFQARAD